MFTKPEREIFQYHDGAAEVWGDPLLIRRRLILECKGRFDTLWDDFFFSPSEEWPDSTPENPRPRWTAEEKAAGILRQAEASEPFLAAVRAAFEMSPFDKATGQGATDADCERAVRAWAAWLADVKKKTPS